MADPTTTITNKGPNPIIKWATGHKKTAVALTIGALIVIAAIIITTTAFLHQPFGQWMHNHVIQPIKDWSQQSGSNSLSKGAWMGIALGCAVGFVIVLVIARKIKQRRDETLKNVPHEVRKQEECYVSNLIEEEHKGGEAGGEPFLDDSSGEK